MHRHYLITAITAVSLIGLSACSNTYKVANERATTKPIIIEQSNEADNHAGWSYSGDTGPEYWGDVEGASSCKIGQEQSPINIARVTASAKDAPAFNYSQAANLRITDNGHTVVYTPATSNNHITIDNESFELKQFHYHTPSEHQFGGQNYPAEVHFVHANNAGNLAVVGLMLEQGAANGIMRILLNGTQLSSENQVEFTANKVNLSALVPAMPTFYHYKGSLTTPPCSEQVQWYVVKQPLALASDQLAIMTDLYQGNNRPIQPQGSRTVEQVSK